MWWRILKFFALVAIVAGVALYVIVNHSEARQELVCRGHWKHAPQQSETAYVRLNEYRRWLIPWASTHGNALVQADKLAFTVYFSEVRRVFDGRMAMYSFHDFNFAADALGRFRGGYRAATNEITVEFTESAVFIGTCVQDRRPL